MEATEGKAPTHCCSLLERGENLICSVLLAEVKGAFLAKNVEKLIETIMKPTFQSIDQKHL